MLLLKQRMDPLQGLVAPDLMRRRSLEAFRDRGPSPQYAVSSFLSPPRQHERVNLEGVSHCAHFDALQLTELNSFELGLQTVPLNPTWAGSSHQTPPLGGSVYFIEGGSAASFSRLLGTWTRFVPPEIGDNWYGVVKLDNLVTEQTVVVSTSQQLSASCRDRVR